MARPFTRLKSNPLFFNYNRLLGFVKPYSGKAVIAILLTIPAGAMDAVVAWAIKPYMDVVVLEKNLSSIQYVPILIIAFSVVRSLLDYTVTYLNHWLAQRVSMDIKATLFDKLMNFHTNYFDSTTSGTIQFRYNSDVDTACNGLISNLRSLLTRIISSLALVGVLFYNSWQLAIVSTVVLFFALYPLTRVRKRILKITDQTVVASSEIATHLTEVYNGNKVISAYNLSTNQSKRFQDSLKQVFKLTMKTLQRISIVSPMMNFISSLGIALTLWYGAYLIIHGHITAGSFVSFIVALLMLYSPIKGIGNNFNRVQTSLLAVERIFELLSTDTAISDDANAVNLEKVKSNITYKNVVFSYNSEKEVLNGINVNIPSGKVTALVGNSGSGKTTFASLLARFYDVTGGSIEIDNVDIRHLTLSSLRDKIAIVFQDNFLFAGTIRQNILMGKLDATEDEFNAAIKSACLENLIAKLPQGADTPIGERGVLLSGGEKQRLAIARALIKNAPIVILDEATSALDNSSEAIVQQAIENLMEGRTVIVIAHRLSTIKKADTILVFDNGSIAESGTHEELLSHGGIYATLHAHTKD